MIKIYDRNIEELSVIRKIAMDVKEFFNLIFRLDSLRKDAPDYYEGESPCIMALEILLNQNIGVEKATYLTLAISSFLSKLEFGRDKIYSVTKWPYSSVPLRPPAKTPYKLLQKYIKENSTIADLPNSAIGALASLERYYNRRNHYFDFLRKIKFTADQISSLTLAEYQKITESNIFSRTIENRLKSVGSIIEIIDQSRIPTFQELCDLKYVGNESTTTLLVYVFKQPYLIIDRYLRRILYRHLIIKDEKISPSNLKKLIMPFIDSHDKAHRLHARAVEIGVSFCLVENENCDECPLKDHFIGIK